MDSNKPDRSAWPRVTEVLRKTGIIDYSQIPNPDFYLQRGNDVHMVCGSILKGEVDYWTGSELEGYAIAFEAFLKDTSFKADQIELPVFNDQRRYRGTLDLLGRMESGKRFLVDIKSGIVAAWVPLQTAAYAACLEDPESINRIGVQLSNTGRYRISQQYKDYRTDSNYFFALVSAVHGRTLYGKCAVED